MQSPDTQAVLADLPALQRLAAGHAPAAARGLWIGLLALDERLRRFASGASEPMLAQLRLAWWRDRLREPPERWPAGEPLLALLRGWERELPALEALVDGWEGTVGDPDAADLAAVADARTGTLLALARLAGARDDPDRIEAASRQWTSGRTGPAPRLSRTMRPLAILAALAGGRRGLGAWLGIVRLGLLGR
jgi:phytoene synthase